MENELYHHGVKGMKWGVRRFQKKDGSLTSAGKKRYSENADSRVKRNNERGGRGRGKSQRLPDNEKRKSKITDAELREYRQEMIARHEKNYSKKEYYENSTDDELRNDIHRKQTLKRVAIAVGVTAGISVGVYAAYKYGSIQKINETLNSANSKSLKDIQYRKMMLDLLDDTEDVFLAKDSVLHRMTAYKDIDFSKVTDPTYVSYKEKDVLTYMTQLKDWSGTGERYDVELKAVKDLVAPSRSKAERIFNKLWDNDPEYREKLSETLQKTLYDLRYGKRSAADTRMLGEKWKRAIMDEVEEGLEKDPFRWGMYTIVRKGDDSKTLINEFKKYGYNAIEDYWDKGDFTDSPLILFDPSSSVVKTGETLVTKAMKQMAETRLQELLRGET